MVTFYRKLDVPERCFMSEALLYLAFRRIPENFYMIEGVEGHFHDHDGSPGPFDEKPSNQYPISDEECAVAGLDPNPSYELFMAGERYFPIEMIDQYLRQYPDHPKAEELTAQRPLAIKHYAAQESWDEACDNYLEYCRSRIFTDICEGKLSCEGKRFKSTSKATLEVELQDADIYDGQYERIEPSYFSNGGLDWTGSFVINRKGSVVMLSLSTEQVFALYSPPQERQFSVWIAGDDIFSAEAPTAQKVTAARGRPSLDWSDFYTEVGRLIREDALPAKKEAGIQYFIEWFLKSKAQQVSRSSVGEKLKPFYSRGKN